MPGDEPAPDSRRRARHLLRRCALGLWFCVLAVLGLVRAWLAASAPGDTVAGLWLWGSLGLLLIGVLALAKALYQPR